VALDTNVIRLSFIIKNSTVFRFSYINGQLRHFPENACDFNIVTINVTKNMFHEIGNVSCFTNLDTLIMKDNLITFVSNATCKGMSKLRIYICNLNRAFVTRITNATHGFIGYYYI
jgi:hypothetical protein